MTLLVYPPSTTATPRMARIIRLVESQTAELRQCALRDHQEFEAQVSSLLTDRYLRLSEEDLKSLARNYFEESDADEEPAQQTPVIGATVRSDCGTFEQAFDAATWFAQASAEQIMALVACGFQNDFPADEVATGSAEFIPELAEFFHAFDVLRRSARGRREQIGFECYVDEDAARAWLAAHRPALVEKLSPADE